MSFPLSPATARTALAAAAVAFAGSVTAAPVYSIQKLEKPVGAHPDNATAISDNGIIVGYGRVDKGPYTAPIIRKRLRSKVLESQARASNEVWAVNTQGEAAGWSNLHAHYWDSTGKPFDLDPLIPCTADIGGKSTKARAINNDGAVLVALECFESGWFDRAYVYQAGTLTALGDLGGGQNRANGMNNLGQVVGSSAVPPDADGKTYDHAYLWENGVMHDLGTAVGGTFSSARAVNDLGHTAVMADDDAGKTRLYLHDGTTMRKLFNCGLDTMIPVAINNGDDIVANTYIAREGYLFQKGHCYHFADLLDATGAGWTSLMVNDIDNKGVIVGEGFLNGQIRGFIATPVTR